MTAWISIRARLRWLTLGVDIVLMRQDPPFDLAYITSTHFLERIHPRTLVVNNPAFWVLCSRPDES